MVKVYVNFYSIATFVGFIEFIVTSFYILCSDIFDPKYICEGLIDQDKTDMDLETCISFITIFEVFIIVLLGLKFLTEGFKKH